MKKLKAFLFTLVLFFISSSYVYAVCDATETNELNSLAVNVSVDYEAVTEEYVPDESFNPPDGMTIEEMENYVVTRDLFLIHISNITEDLYVTVENDVTGETNTYYYDDSENGVITIRQEDLTSITNYTVTVYSSDATNCPNTRLATHYLTTPMYNYLSEYDECEGAEDFYLCYEYLSVPIVGFDDFMSLVEDYKAGKVDNNGEEIVPDEDEEKGFLEFLSDHKAIVITVCAVIVVGGVLVTVIIVKKRRSKIV